MCFPHCRIRTETRRFPACSTAQIIFTRREFGLAKRLSGFAVCGGSLLNGNRYRDCKPRKRVRNENEREKKQEREKERARREGNTNAAFSRQANGISALCKQNSTFLCKDRPWLADFSRLKRTCSDKPCRFSRVEVNTDA